MSNKLVVKSESDDKRIVWAEVYAPNRPDADGEFMTAADIELMAYDFMRKMTLDSVDSYHDNVLVDGCCVVESFIARKDDPLFIEGSWVVGMHVDNDEMWEKIRRGDINGFSMEAEVYRVPCEAELDMPPVVTGKTLVGESDDGEVDHVHTFYVSYSPDGVFKGGVTDSVAGHRHRINHGSYTAKEEGHTHRFSHVEDVQLTNIQEAPEED